MGDLSTTILAKEEGGGNFLLPNGTFIFVSLTTPNQPALAACMLYKLLNGCPEWLIC